MNLRVKSVFLLLCLEGSLVGWSQELPAMATDVHTVSATGLEIRLPGPQGVAASEGLLGSHFGDGASSLSRTVSQVHQRQRQK